jgi:arabinogalactan oligomer/maltooligosaccharide transport system permease protein
MTQMFPATMLLLPFFILLAKLKLINSYLGLIIIYSSTALPFCIWQMKGYYDTIPAALEEAARMDGCSRFSAFIKVILPVSAPALVITALFSFMASWSEYVVAAIVLQNPELYTLPLGLKSFQASLATQWGLYAAGAVVVSIPVMILFISLSKFLVSGLTVGSVKG